jgi:hypothetical protein
MRYLYLLIIALFLVNCESAIKNKETEVKEETGTETTSSTDSQIKVDSLEGTKHPLCGFWVGFFEKDVKTDKDLYVEERIVWNRENKINLSIDRIIGDKVFGHSVVAGNNRPFSGTLIDNKFVVTEPGDNVYDGTFTFSIQDDTLVGTWKAFKNIDISKRKYKLTRKLFEYNPSQMLDNNDGEEFFEPFIDWEKKQEIVINEHDGEAYKMISFAQASNLIFKINASSTVLAKKDVDNLSKSDLKLIRNTIYARHGYTFKNRPLRVFFDSQEWYIPLFTDVRNELTEIEKKNIALLLRYEENAEEYYDTFGR